MNQSQQLTISYDANGFALVADIGKPSEHVVASRVPDAPAARLLGAAPELASAAIFAVRALHAQGMDAVVKIAFDKLLRALAIAGIQVDGFQAREPVALAPHPDTLRLDHLIEWDRSVIGHVKGDDNQPAATIEKIEFILESLTGDSAPDAVRAAIDNSIKVLSLPEVGAPQVHEETE